MAITDELRELKGRTNTLLSPGSVLALRSEINRIADHIDAEHETLERRIDELCAENERLRQENQSIGMAAYELGRASLADENERLRQENAKLRGARDVWQENDAKLRELVRDMWLQLLNAYDRKEVDEFADRMCELGILKKEA